MKVSLVLITFMCLIISCNKNIETNNSSFNKTIDSLRRELTISNDELKSLKANNDSKIELRYNNENFDAFFWSFMTDSTFQLERIKFPLKYITWEDELGGEIDTIKLIKPEWKYNSFYLNTASERTQIYDNFELNLRTTNERLLHWYGVETGGDSKYYFTGKNGKWYLTKWEQLGD
ncbi:DUF4348 domain-containing protein [Winogradskyella echinorum]|uniref:DUF4348 domain-containing protein n=1 Tax=Winogradskyella echinorum TaxID=538189 RepID=A0ABR6Y5G4_9FLAO|nr:DUF4348 domain-containing protein [Winogradskyella echinorum]MBC3848003.1 DUF4348 domain-containing protein [Winogradskyella echinorum]MBC5752351.1 DUF4348 domain-containing protein [Winogradskyella echinorum]